MRRSLAVVLVAISAGAVLRAQTPALTFEAASVKPNRSVSCDRGGSLAGGRFAMTCSTLRALVTFAYPRQDGSLRFDSDLVGGPSWIDADRFDLVARIPEGRGLGFDAGNTPAAAATPAQLSAIEPIRAMTRSLLEDRFKLAVHDELRDLNVYELRLDRRDARPGPQLKRAEANCVSKQGNPCAGFKMSGPGHLVSHGVTMSMLAQFLESPTSRRVFDRTGLNGSFDVELQWAPSDPNGVSVFTALREQLGLKLESTKAPVDVLVIDRAEKPTPN